MSTPLLTPPQVAEILRGRRKARRLSQQAIAKKLGVSQSRLSALEADPAKLTLDRLLLLAKLLGLEVALQERTEPKARKAAW